MCGNVDFVDFFALVAWLLLFHHLLPLLTCHLHHRCHCHVAVLPPPLGCCLGFVIVIMWLSLCDCCCAHQHHCRRGGGEPWQLHLHGYQCWAGLSRASEWRLLGVV